MDLIPLSDCKKKTGFDEWDLLSLTGIFGVHHPEDFLALRNTSNIKVRIYFDDDDVLNVEISDTPIVKMLKVHINSPQHKEIYIDLFRLQPSHKGANIGFKRLTNQIEAAVRLGFKRISLWAYGDISKFPTWDGYIIWGKYGFSMYKQGEIDNFDEMMSDDRLVHCTTINHLVHTKEGTAYWKHQGNDWRGEFILKDNSHNMNVYRKYGFDRGLL